MMPGDAGRVNRGGRNAPRGGNPLGHMDPTGELANLPDVF